MNENYERVKVTLFRMTFYILLLAIVLVLLKSTKTNSDFIFFYTFGVFNVLISSVAIFIRMKYFTYVINDSDEFIKLINSKKVVMVEIISDVTIYKIRSKYNLFAFKVIVSYIDKKIRIRAPKVMSYIFDDYKILIISSDNTSSSFISS